jgi:DNA sulfur modification protein DndE
MIENIRLAERAKTQLITLKRRTGIKNWNVLCRWAFAVSLAEPSTPPNETIPSDSSVEMSWRTFGGKHERTYWALLATRAKRDGIPPTVDQLSAYFRLHLHRGISYLCNRVESNIGDLLQLPLSEASRR